MTSRKVRGVTKEKRKKKRSRTVESWSKAVASCAIVALVITCCLQTSLAGGANATVSAQDFQNANHEIQSAYVSVSNAERDGGNVSLLIQQLNGAVQLVQNAESENATNPSQASSNLNAAFQQAQGVMQESNAVAQAGAAAKQTRDMISIGSAAVVAIVAALVYIYGGRIYRNLWFQFYRDYTCRVNGIMAA